MGWIGNIFIVIGYILLGQKRNSGWIFNILGHMIWVCYGVTISMMDIVFIDGLTLIIAIRNWRLWKHEL